MKNLDLKSKMANRISRRKDNVFLRRDFVDLGNYTQIGKALNNLIKENKLTKIGYGIYCKTEISSISGKLILSASFPTLAREALKKLGVKVLDSSLENDYNSGRSTQIPTGRLVGVNKRITRKIMYEKSYISYEHAASR